MNDLTKAFRMSCSVFPECNRGFRGPVWTRAAVEALLVAGAARRVSGSRRLASMMAHPSMEGRLA